MLTVEKLPVETQNWLSGIRRAWEAYRASEEFHKSIDSSTAAGWGGSGYSVELFEDGSFRLLWNSNIGNLYDSPGKILSIPQLGDEEWDEDPDLRYYDNAEEEMEEAFQEWHDSFPEMFLAATELG